MKGQIMGMDVIGKNPTSKVGEYFRANVWFWHPLWGYVENVHPEIAELVEHAHSNDGDGLGAMDSLKLAELLEEDLKCGRVAEYEVAYWKRLSEIPMEDCYLCEGSGIRKDDVGGWNTKELPPEVQSLVGRTHGSCNSCSGYGKTTAWETNYPFRESVVEEFAKFLADCGGFEIC